MQKLVFESYTLANADDNVQNPCYEKKPLGFAAQLMSLNGYDPMSLSPVFAATQRISNAVGMMPWEYKPFEDDTISDNHWFNHLFDNCLQTQFIFTKNIIKDIITEGNGYALIERKNGKPYNLIYLPKGTCSPIIDTLNVKLVYNVSFGGKLVHKYEPKDIIHVFVNSGDGVIGTSLFNFAHKTIKLASYTEKAAMNYFGSGMRLTGVLSTDSPRLKADQREEIRNNYLAGIESERGIAVLEAGMKFEQMSNNARDAQLIDSRKYNVQEIARYFNIAPTELGDYEHNIYGTLEAGSISFITNTCRPYVVALEQELTRKLLTVDERKKFYISLNEDVLVKSDRTTYANYVTSLYNTGLMSKNEGRDLIGLPRLEDGDEYVIPYQGTTQNPSYNNSNQLSNGEENDDKNKNINTKPDETSKNN